MSKFDVTRSASPNLVARVFLADSTSTTGAGKTGIGRTQVDLKINVIRELSAAPTNYVGGTSVEDITTLGTYAAPTAANCRFKEVDATNLPGVYEIQLEQSAGGTADASRFVTGMIRATGVAPCPFEISLEATNRQDSVRGGQTSLPNAAAGANGGLPLSVDASGRVDVLKLNGTNQTARDIGASVLVGDKTGFSLSSAGVQAIWDAATSALTTIGSIGLALTTAASNVATLISRLTSARAGYLDNLNIGGNVASSAEVTAIQNNTRVVRVVPPVIERPDSAPDTYRVELLLYDDNGNMEAPDSAPTIALVNQSGTDRSSRLDSATMALVETGRYRAIYTADPGDTLEQLVWTFSVVEGGATRKYGNQSLIVDTTAVDFTSADRTKLEALETRLTATRAGYLDNLSAGAVATASALSTAAGNVATLLGKFTGITALAQWLGAMAGKQTPDATALAEIRATGAGSGTYDPTTDSPEAIRDGVDDIPTNSELSTALAAADDAVLAAIAALENLSAAEVNNEVVDALATDTRAEPGVGAPPATASIGEKIDYLYKAWRNKKTQTATLHTVFNDDGSTAGQKATVSGDGTTTTVGEMVSGA